MRTPDYSSAVEYLKQADRPLARVIERIGRMPGPPRREFPIFYSLLRAIVYQQLAGKAAAAILQRVHDVFPDTKYPTPEGIAAASDEVLRAAGLSRNKLAAIRDLAAKALDGTVPTARQARYLSDQELVERLTAVRGIGVWTVEMLLIFRLGRLDVLPVTDYGVRKGFQLAFRMKELPTPKQVLARGERWRPYRSVASWYLWRVLEL